MGISLTLFTAADEELERFQTDTEALNRVLGGNTPHAERPSCYLSSYWRGLHRILTAEGKEDVLPLAALTTGDLRYPKANDTAHALRNSTVRELASALEAFSEPQVRTYVEGERDEAERKYGGTENAARWIPNQATVEQEIREYWFYLRNVQAITAQAAAQGHGLLFCFWEDW